jgi:hypothetical protein
MYLGSKEIIRSRRLSIIREATNMLFRLEARIKDHDENPSELSVAVRETLILRS